MRQSFVERGDPAIDADRSGRHRLLEAIDAVVIERRDVAVFLRRQALQPRFTGVNNQRIGTGGDRCARESVKRLFRILIVDADAAFHRHRDANRALHRGDALGDKVRFGHQAGAEAAVLHTIRRTADIEIDLVIAKVFANSGGGGEIGRVRAAKLQRHRMLHCVEAEQPLAVAVDHRAGRDHLRVEPRAPRHEAMENAAMPVGPVHHGGHGESMVGGNHARTLC